MEAAKAGELQSCSLATRLQEASEVCWAVWRLCSRMPSFGWLWWMERKMPIWPLETEGMNARELGKDSRRGQSLVKVL